MIVSAILTVAITLILSAFFSGMEIAFLSSNKLKVELDKKESRSFNRVADIFMHHPGQYITTLLVGNNIALVIYTLQLTLVLNLLFGNFKNDFPQLTILVETIISTILIIFTAEYLPKAIVKSNPNFYLRIFSLPLYFFYIVLYPLARFSTWLSSMILKIFGIRIGHRGGARTFNKVDLAHFAEEVAENTATETTEQDLKLFQNALDFSELKVRHCMVPRVDMEVIDIREPIGKLMELFNETRFSRIPVYRDSIDNIVGYVNSKSMLLHPSSIQEILIPVDYVPESMRVQKLLSAFIKRHHSLAIVIDEFGGTGGMITIEDILEEIFGEIEDEHDTDDLIEKQIDDKTFIFSPRLEIDYLNEKYDLNIPVDEEYDTLAGYIIYHNEGLPKVNDQIRVGDMMFRILKSSNSRIELVKLELK